MRDLILWCFTHTRHFFGVVATFCVSMLTVGWILQYAVGLTPCPLCIIQRFFFGGVGVTAFIAWLHGRGERVYLAVMFGLALLGGLVAGRNVYIEWIPQGLDKKCIPWMESFTDWITVLFQATGDCTKRDWTLLGVSIPEWSLLAFIFLTVATGWILAKKTSDDPVSDQK